MTRTKVRRLFWVIGVAIVLFPGTTVVVPRFAPRAEAAFPGNNGLIAISILTLGEESRSIGDHDIFTIRPGGAAVRALMTGPTNDIQPSWSPDGSRIAFVRSDALNGGIGANDIYVADADGADENQLTDTPFSIEYEPSWSPDGTEIVFAREDAPGGLLGYLFGGLESEIDLYIMDADGRSPAKRVTSDPGYESSPAWSPTGKWIAFQHEDDVAIVRPDGSGLRVLTSVGGADYRSPQWSPDGSRVAFSSGSGVWVVNVGGESVGKLVSDGRRPSWSPNGRWIAFISDRDGSWQLFKMRSDGSDVTKLIDIDLRAPEATPDWGPRS